MDPPQAACVMRKLHIGVEKYMPTFFLAALKRTPWPMMVGFGHVVHQTGKGISKRTVIMPCEALAPRAPKACFPCSLLPVVVPSRSGGTYLPMLKPCILVGWGSFALPSSVWI